MRNHQPADDCAQSDTGVGCRYVQSAGQRLGMGCGLHDPHLADREQRGIGNAPQHQRHDQPWQPTGQRHTGSHAQAQQQRERRRDAQRATIDKAPAQPVAEQADRTEAHQPPAHLRRRDTGNALQYVGQIGVRREHRGKHHHRQQHVGDKTRVLEDARLLAQAQALRFGQRGHEHGQRRRHRQRQPGQHPERTAPAEGVGRQGAQRNAEQQRGGNAQVHLRHGTAGALRASQLPRRLASGAPEHRQHQRRDEARQSQYPDIRCQCRQGIGRGEDHQDGHEQLLAPDMREQRGQQRAEQHYSEGKQRDQLPGQRNGDIQIPRQRRQQPDDEKFSGDDDEGGHRQNGDGQAATRCGSALGRYGKGRHGQDSGTIWPTVY